MIKYGQKVQCYWNIHKGQWSVRSAGKVIARVPRLVLSDCRFRVQPSGRQRVLREKKKNVHAYVSGTYYGVLGGMEGSRVYKATYNPYLNEEFQCNGAPIKEAMYVQLNEDKTVECVI